MKNRMNQIMVVVCVVLAVGISSGYADLIDFDDGTNGASVGSFYSGLGVTFSNTSWYEFTLAGSSPPMTIGSSTTPYQSTQATAAVATFDTPMASVAITALDVGDRGARLDAYDAGGTLVDFDEYIGTGVGVGDFQTLLTSAAGISRIELYQPVDVQSGDGMVWDNLEFTPVPVPGAVLLGMIGLSVVGVKLRKHT